MTINIFVKKKILPFQSIVKKRRQRESVWHGACLGFPFLFLCTLPVAETDDYVDVFPVKARIFGDKLITAIAPDRENREVADSSSVQIWRHAVFVQQNPQIFSNRTTQAYLCAETRLVPLAICSLRWEIEISCLELKSFWAFREYRVRSRDGIERLLNLQPLVYSVFSLLPILDSELAPFEQLSIQERRWHMEQLFSQEMLFHRLEERLQTDKNTLAILQQCRGIVLQDTFAA